jgi:hypothetical protein
LSKVPNALGYLIIASLSTVLYHGSCLAQSGDAEAYKVLAVVLSNLASDPVVLLNPGLFIDPTYDSSDVVERRALSTRFNTLVKPTLLFAPSGRTLGELYVSVLTNAQWSELARFV